MYDYADIECPKLNFDIAANDSIHFWWRTKGFEDCIVQAIASDPSITAWVLTVERANHQKFVAQSAATTIPGTGTAMSDRIEIAGALMRARVSTDAAAACTARVVVRLRGEGTGRDRSKEFVESVDYGWTYD